MSNVDQIAGPVAFNGNLGYSKHARRAAAGELPLGMKVRRAIRRPL